MCQISHTIYKCACNHKQARSHKTNTLKLAFRELFVHQKKILRVKSSLFQTFNPKYHIGCQGKMAILLLKKISA